MILTTHLYQKFEPRLELNTLIQKNLTQAAILIHKRKTALNSYSLQIAISNGNLTLVKYLISKNAPVELFFYRLSHNWEIKQIVHDYYIKKESALSAYI